MPIFASKIFKLNSFPTWISETEQKGIKLLLTTAAKICHVGLSAWQHISSERRKWLLKINLKTYRKWL